MSRLIERGMFRWGAQVDRPRDGLFAGKSLLARARLRLPAPTPARGGALLETC